jgi:hypothetical protein
MISTKRPTRIEKHWIDLTLSGELFGVLLHGTSKSAELDVGRIGNCPKIIPSSVCVSFLR